MTDLARGAAAAWAALGCATLLAAGGPAMAAGHSLRFFGHGVNDIDRVKIEIDDPQTSLPGPPVDVGATDFTIEFWMKANASENQAPARTCGFNIDWIHGNIVLDRDRFNQDRKYGLSIAGGALIFGVSGDGTGDMTICGTSSVVDGEWHHVAVQRRRADGRIDLYVDGVREAEADGPDGDVSYPDDGFPLSQCGGQPCLQSDPFLVLAAEKHDAGSQFPSYSGWLDEMRVSATLRYTGAQVAVPDSPFDTDASTVGLYHLDDVPEAEGPCTGVVPDSSGAIGGPSNGECRFGGSAPAGPRYSLDTPFPDLPGLPALAAQGLVALALGLAAGGGIALRRWRERAARRGH